MSKNNGSKNLNTIIRMYEIKQPPLLIIASIIAISDLGGIVRQYAG